MHTRYKHITFSALWIVGCTSWILAAVGICAVKKIRNDLKNKTTKTRMKETIGQDIILAYFYFSIIISLAQFCVAAVCLFY
jgi:hypothetical protein